MAWILREFFDYQNVNQKHKKRTIRNMHEFIRKNPTVLIKSIKTMKRDSEKLREKVEGYLI